MCRLTQNSWAKGRNHIKVEPFLRPKVRPFSGPASGRLYFSLNRTHRKKDRMAKLKTSGLTSVRWIKIDMESKKEITNGQKATPKVRPFSVSRSDLNEKTENKRKKTRRIKKVLTKINPVKPVKLKMPKKITSLNQ